MSELVHGDVVALVVHSVRSDPGTEEGIVTSAHRAPGMAGPPGSFDRDLVGDIFSPVLVETQLLKHLRHPFFESLRRRIPFSGDCRKAFLRNRSAALEPVIPDVERTEFAAEPLADDRGYHLHLRRGNQVHEQFLDFLCGDLHPTFEVSLDTGRHARMERVSQQLGMEGVKNTLIPPLPLRLGIDRGAIFPDLVGIWSPVIFGIIYNNLRNLLGDNAFEDFVNHLLLLRGIRQIGVVGLDFIPEIPMRQQTHVLREKSPAVLCQHMAHHDVVRSDVVLGIGVGLRRDLAHFGRHAGGIEVSHP